MRKRQQNKKKTKKKKSKIMVGVKQVNKMSQKQVKSIPKRDDQMLPTEQVKRSLHLLITGDSHW